MMGTWRLYELQQHCMHVLSLFPLMCADRICVPRLSISYPHICWGDCIFDQTPGGSPECLFQGRPSLGVLAHVCGCNIGSHSGQPIAHNCNFLYYKAIYVTRMFSTRYNGAHVSRPGRPGLLSGGQLYSYGSMCRSDYWIPECSSNWQCVW